MLAICWLFASFLPAVLAAYLVWRSDKRREPWLPATGTFVLGALCAVPTFYLQEKASSWTGLDVRSAIAGDAGSLLFQFALVSPVRELAKVAASWPAFQSKHFDEPYDGVVYAALASMGFATYDGAWHLWHHRDAGIWMVRVLLALPAHLFFACLWGYALGRAKKAKRPGKLFPLTWLAATVGHAFYAHFTYGRGPGALVALVPMLLMMALVATMLATTCTGAERKPFVRRGSRRRTGGSSPRRRTRSPRRAPARQACAPSARRCGRRTGRSWSAGSSSAPWSRSAR